MDTAETKLRTKSAEGVEPTRSAGAPGLLVTDADVLDEAVASACGAIAPTWPLDRFTAVNPFWGLVDRPLVDAAAELHSLSGTRMLMPRSWYREQRAAGRLRDEHLRAALREVSGSISGAMTLERLLALLDQDEPDPARRSRCTDVADAERRLEREVAWCDFVTNSISQFCAAYFDGGQAALGPDREGGLYASWRRQALEDRSPALLMGLDGYERAAAELPATPRALLRRALADLEVPEGEWSAYLTSLLLDMNGWASACAYRRWTARLQGDDDASIEQFLAVRAAWEWLLHRTGGERFGQRWRRALAAWPETDAIARSSRAHDWVFQRALELGWRDGVARGLAAGGPQSGAGTGEAPGRASLQPRVQAVFCIDVRSEVFRRALEAESDAVQTLGFAGFFGLPIEYRPLGAPSGQPQLPALLAPRLRVTEGGVGTVPAQARADRLSVRGAWKVLKTGAVSTFSFVEALGPGFAWRLLADGLGWGSRASAVDAGLTAQERAARRPRLTEDVAGRALAVSDRVELAAGMLRAMSLTRGFAPLVALLGHGSSTRNNPHAAGLDCGACCGQTGEVNARAAAALLNEPAVREGLRGQGIDVPAGTRFVAGLHDTTTDEVRLFELDELPVTHGPDVAALERWLERAGARARAERAPSLGLADRAGRGLLAALRRRTTDWAQVRPEWGLADNATFVVAPRERTRHLDLGGRAFLHDYRQGDDVDGSVLELIMTAPMVVTHWINFQYYASTVDNRRYGSGNKVLHNVVGAHLGVFEGNGGDLRAGLALQSVHDGQRWRHTPQRLSVFIEASAAAIEDVLGRHATVRNLVHNGWLELLRIEAADGRVHAYRPDAPAEGRWVEAAGRERADEPVVAQR